MYITTDKLEVGAWYICEGRCPRVCMWNGKRFETIEPFFKNQFTHNDHYIHWDDDPKFGTVQPMKKI